MFRKRKHKDSKLLAYESLIKYQVNSLPVPFQVAMLENVKIFSLQYMAKYFNDPIDECLARSGHRGFIFYQESCSRYVIFLNAEDPEPILRWSLSQAIGYIESNSRKQLKTLFFDSPEKYIEDFTYTFTCPDCILEKNDLTSLNDIVKFCCIPFPNAMEKRKRLFLASKIKDNLETKLDEILNDLITIHRIDD